jgi:poly(beta-D-mannuronate) lyase
MRCAVILLLLPVNNVGAAGHSVGVELPVQTGSRYGVAISPVACPSFAPVMALDLENIYHDPRSSVPDVRAEERNGIRLKHVIDFMQFIEQKLDRRDLDTAQRVCAFDNFRSWAVAGALTNQPFVKYSREGTITRNQDLLGMLVIAIKFKESGFFLDDAILDWLGTLTQQEMDFFERATNRSNLYYWSGAAAALLALIDREPRALTYQERVWQAAILDIQYDGTLVAEMARGQRALIYHMYAFSALLMLRAAREPLGYQTSGAAAARLRLLAGTIGRALCNPQLMGKLASANIETPGNWAYRIPAGLGRDLISSDWSRCGNLIGNTVDIGFGGDTRLTATALRLSGSSTH